MDSISEALANLAITERRIQTPRVVAKRAIIEDDDIPLSSIRGGLIQGHSFIPKSGLYK